MAYRCKTHESKECDGCGECQERRTKKIYGVTITLNQIAVEAENEDEAMNKAVNILYSGMIAHLQAGMTIEDVDVVKLDEEEE